MRPVRSLLRPPLPLAGVLSPERTAVLGLLLAWLFAAGGCATCKPQPAGAQPQYRTAIKAAVVLGEEENISRTAVNRLLFKSRTPPSCPSGRSTFDVLVLSGGGDYGAFGAGVLQGWGTVADPQMRRPMFDVVTGVSTGAIIAPLAFVGVPETYDRVFLVYQNPKPDWYRKRVLPAIVTGRPSLATNDGIAEEIRTIIDCRVIAAIAAGAAENRLLLIETTDLDQGVQQVWNLTAEAQRVVAGAPPKRLHDIILASTSIPGVFPPVEIDGQLHVDGGVTQNIIFAMDRSSQTSVLNAWKREHGEMRPARIRYWVLINNQLATRADRVRDRWSDVSKRSVEMMVRASTVQSLRSVEMLSDLMRVEGFEVEFRFMAIPDGWRPPVEGSFKAETMISLARLGQQMGADPRNWRSTVPGEIERMKADTEWVVEPH